MSSTELLEENEQKLIDIRGVLNGPESPTTQMAYEHNVVQVVEELIELYVEAQGKLDEIQDMVGNRW